MDDIQQKLALIDRERAGGKELQQQILSTSPLAFIAAGLIIGILIQDILTWPIHFWLMLLVSCTVGTFILFAVSKMTCPSYVTAYLACICFACLGAIRLGIFYQPRPDDIRNFVTDDRKLATIRGQIITEPYINENQQWQFAQFTYNDPTTSFYLKLKEVKTIRGWAKVHGTIRVQVAEPLLDLKAGDSIQAYCWLDRFKTTTNPGQFDVAKYMARRNVFIAASIESRDSIKLLENSHTDYLSKVKRKLREIAMQALLGDTLAENQSQGLLQALLLGYRQNIDNATYEAFRKTGLLHFICLSGMNFMILFWIIWRLCKTAGLMKPAQAIICMAAASTFLLVIPPNSPAIRAAIMSSIFCISFLFRRKYNPFNTLSLAAVILLLVRPTYLFEPGWQLSFASVAGILLFTGPIENFIHERTTDKLGETDTQKRSIYIRIIFRITSPVIKVFAVSFAAWLASAGILLYHFYTINYLTSIWTVVVSPLIAAISVIGYSKIVLALFLPSIASMLDMIIIPLTGLLVWIVKLFASWNISEILIGSISSLLIILYYLFILFVFFVYLQHPLLKKAICMAMALTVIVFLGITKWQRTYRDDLILNCLDVGHGQAILAQLPGKTNVIFDAGSMYKNDIGKRIVAPFLDYSGINKIDAIIISHNDVDHINGIPEIVEHCDVNGVYANDAFFSAAETDPCDTAGTLKTLLKNQGLEIQRLGTDLNLNSKARIKILWLSEETQRNEKLSDNDKSVVSLIEFAGRNILLCSDIEKIAQRELLRPFHHLKADVVIVPHHGLAASLEPGFLENLKADILINSCDQSQYERTKPITGLGTINTNKTKSFYTARDGTITIHINEYGTIKTDTFVE